MHKKTAIFVLFILFAGFFTGIVNAQTELLSGQKHYYTAIFRGNGEAIVFARLVITNNGEKPLTEFSFEMPRATASEISMVQQTLPKTCSRYDNPPPGPNGVYVSPKCVEYTESNYDYPPYYRSDPYGVVIEQTTYDKINFTKSGNLYKFDLPKSVEPGKTTAVVVAYAANGYTAKSGGSFDINFETFRVPYRISEARVAVDVDSELYIEGKKSQVNYSVPQEMMAAPKAAGLSAVSSQQLDEASRRIGSYGVVMKTAKYLAPNETLTVKGKYSDNWAAFYAVPLIIFFLIVIGLFVGIYYLAKFVGRKRAKNVATEDIAGVATTGASVSVPLPAFSERPSTVASMVNLLNLSMGLLSAAVVIVLSSIIEPAGKFIDNAFNPSTGPVFIIVMVIMMAILYILSIFGPAALVVRRNGWKGFFAVLIAQFAWYFIFLILYLIFTQTVGKGGGTTPIM